MWFEPDGDPKKFFKGVWFILKWMLIGPVFGVVVVGLFGLLVGGWEGLKGGVFWGLIFGMMGGVGTAGAKVLSDWNP